MPRFISINVGFVTNSSSVVYHFPKEILEHPDVAAFLSKMSIEDGFVGSDMWDRYRCESFAVTKTQKEAVRSDMLHGSGSEYCTGAGINTDTDEVIVVFGDEYPGVAMTLCEIISKAMNREDHYGSGQSYN